MNYQDKISRTISQFIYSQLPATIHLDFEKPLTGKPDRSLFTRFLELYYEFLEKTASLTITDKAANSIGSGQDRMIGEYSNESVPGLYGELMRISGYRDVDLVKESLKQNLYDEFLANYTGDLLGDKDRLMKIVSLINRSKGTELSYQILFRFAWNSSAKFVKPSQEIFKISSNKYHSDLRMRIREINSSVEPSKLANFSEFDGTYIVGDKSGARAFVLANDHKSNIKILDTAPVLTVVLSDGGSGYKIPGAIDTAEDGFSLLPSTDNGYSTGVVSDLALARAGSGYKRVLKIELFENNQSTWAVGDILVPMSEFDETATHTIAGWNLQKGLGKIETTTTVGSKTIYHVVTEDPDDVLPGLDTPQYWNYGLTDFMPSEKVIPVEVTVPATQSFWNVSGSVDSDNVLRRYCYQGALNSKTANGMITYYDDERALSVGFDNTKSKLYKQTQKLVLQSVTTSNFTVGGTVEQPGYTANNTTQTSRGKVLSWDETSKVMYVELSEATNGSITPFSASGTNDIEEYNASPTFGGVSDFTTGTPSNDWHPNQNSTVSILSTTSSTGSGATFAFQTDGDSNLNVSSANNSGSDYAVNDTITLMDPSGYTANTVVLTVTVLTKTAGVGEVSSASTAGFTTSDTIEVEPYVILDVTEGSGADFTPGATVTQDNASGVITKWDTTNNKLFVTDVSGAFSSTSTSALVDGEDLKADAVLTATVNSGGSGYAIGDTLNVDGNTGTDAVLTVATIANPIATFTVGTQSYPWVADQSATTISTESDTSVEGSGATFSITTNSSGTVTINATPVNAGTNYAIGDILTLKDPGTSSEQTINLTVATITPAPGAIASFESIDGAEGGTGYTASNSPQSLTDLSSASGDGTATIIMTVGGTRVINTTSPAVGVTNVNKTITGNVSATTSTSVTINNLYSMGSDWIEEGDPILARRSDSNDYVRCVANSTISSSGKTKANIEVLDGHFIDTDENSASDDLKFYTKDSAGTETDSGITGWVLDKVYYQLKEKDGVGQSVVKSISSNGSITETSTTYGTGSGLTVNYTILNPGGGIVSATAASAGTGYLVGDRVYVLSNTADAYKVGGSNSGAVRTGVSGNNAVLTVTSVNSFGGVTSLATLTSVGSNFLSTGTDVAGDINRDGVVDIFDLVLASREVGSGYMTDGSAVATSYGLGTDLEVDYDIKRTSNSYEIDSSSVIVSDAGSGYQIGEEVSILHNSTYSLGGVEVGLDDVTNKSELILILQDNGSMHTLGSGYLGAEIKQYTSTGNVIGTISGLGAKKIVLENVTGTFTDNSGDQFDIIRYFNGATAVDANNITLTSHGLENNDAVIYIHATSSAAIGGLTFFQTYYVRDKTNDTFKLAETSGGTALTLTAGSNDTGHAIREVGDWKVKRIDIFDPDSTVTFNSAVTGKVVSQDYIKKTVVVSDISDAHLDTGFVVGNSVTSTISGIDHGASDSLPTFTVKSIGNYQVAHPQNGTRFKVSSLASVTGTGVALDGGTGSGATVNYTTTSRGSIAHATINAAGADYKVGDELTIKSDANLPAGTVGGNSRKIRVDKIQADGIGGKTFIKSSTGGLTDASAFGLTLDYAVNSSGVVTSVTINNPGEGYKEDNTGSSGSNIEEVYLTRNLQDKVDSGLDAAGTDAYVKITDTDNIILTESTELSLRDDVENGPFNTNETVTAQDKDGNEVKLSNSQNILRAKVEPVISGANITNGGMGYRVGEEAVALDASGVGGTIAVSSVSTGPIESVILDSNASNQGLVIGANYRIGFSIHYIDIYGFVPTKTGSLTSYADIITEFGINATWNASGSWGYDLSSSGDSVWPSGDVFSNYDKLSILREGSTGTLYNIVKFENISINKWRLWLTGEIKTENISVGKNYTGKQYHLSYAHDTVDGGWEYGLIYNGASGSAGNLNTDQGWIESDLGYTGATDEKFAKPVATCYGSEIKTVGPRVPQAIIESYDNNKITGIELLDEGDGYSDFPLPYAYNSVGNNEIDKSCKLYSYSSKIGSITGTEVKNIGVGYTGNEMIFATKSAPGGNDGTGYPKSTAIGTLETSPVYRTKSRAIDNIGWADGTQRLRDPKVFNDFSYVLESSVSPEVYTKMLEKTVHPAGFKSTPKYVYAGKPDTHTKSVITSVATFQFNGVTGVDADNDLITIALHGLNNNDTVKYKSGATAIGGLTSGNTYYVIKDDDNNIQLSLTASGSAITLTDGSNDNHYLSYYDNKQTTT